jgi:hypothetical protein
VTVRGVTEIQSSATDHPGLHLILKNEEEAVEIHACPARFLSELEFTIEIGDKLSVVGSRQGRVIVARGRSPRAS